MSHFNVPDDWGSYFTNCSICGSRYHLSEGGCNCTEDLGLCSGGGCGSSTDRDSYHPYNKLTAAGSVSLCGDCLICECCDVGRDVTYNDEHGLLLCPGCVEEEHECPTAAPATK